MTELTATAIEVHALQIERLHNDSTSITFEGAYKNADEGAVQLARGYNKNHRPDCKQIVYGLNLTEDGQVPLSFQWYDGNQADITTHCPNWEAVREGKALDWTHEFCLPDSRKKAQAIVYRLHEGECRRGEYRLRWIHSLAKQRQDEKRREALIVKDEQALEALSAGLNQYQLKTRASIEKAIIKACKNKGDFFPVDLIENKTEVKTKIGPGRPGPQTQYKSQTVVTYELVWHRDAQAIAKDVRIDGLFPLVDHTDLDAPDVLLTDKMQPYLEKRFATKKSVLDVAPVFLKTPRRIEAMMFLYFVALMIVSLIERHLRQEMQAQEIPSLPILPSKLKTKTPTWNNLRTFFSSVHLAKVIQGNQVLNHLVKGLTALHDQLLQLLKVPRSIYETLQDG